MLLSSLAHKKSAAIFVENRKKKVRRTFFSLSVFSVQHRKPITAPSITITNSVVPATIKLEESQCCWLKYDQEAHSWNKVDSGVFEANEKYAYRVRIFPEDPAFDFINVSL